VLWNGKPQFQVVYQDITEQRKMQEQLMAQDRLASLGQLVSGIAHELNNPLTGVIGFSDMLLKRDLPDDVKADLKVINDEAMRTARIVKNLLTFARKQPEGKTAVDINENIRGVLNLRDHEQKVNNIRVITHFASDLPQVMGNSSQLQQVFFNIVINAEQAMLEAHGRGGLIITTEQMGDMVRVSFTDDGPGISPENMRKLFTPFFTTKEVGKGTGLGLSICYGIVTEHGGRIYAESEAGKGATFVVELPVSKQ
jgi:C4-dicarboxylate-specific signal transduction histidine kinase